MKTNQVRWVTSYTMDTGYFRICSILLLTTEYAGMTTGGNQFIHFNKVVWC